MKCFTCGRKIQNPYMLDGKVYGHECYKLALAQKYIHLQELKNDDWTKKCIAAIELFRNVEFKKSAWNQEFQKSVLTQWDKYHKLSGKQFEIILKNIDTMEYNYIYFNLLEDEEKKNAQARYITNWTKHNRLIEKYKNDNRLHEAIRIEHKTGIERRGRKYYIVEFIDIDEPERKFFDIVPSKSLEDLQNDEYIEIKNLIEVV
ncbi:MAG TPA: hypothetical protein DEG71_06325 [Clostridiales bacterium]|nr:hypothetical protein [Clostridiales bacterium]